MKRIICLIAVGLIAAAVFGQKQQQPNLPEQASEVASEEIEWVWKKDFPEEIQDIVVDMKKVRRKIMKDNKEVEIEEETIFPKVVVTERKGGVKGAKIRFYDKDGKIKKEYTSRPIGTLIITKAKNDKFIGKSELSAEGERNAYPGELEVYDIEGNVVWKKAGIIPYELFLSPDGKYVVGLPGGPGGEVPIGEVYFVYPNKETKLIKLDISHPESHKIDFKEDGDLVAVNIGDPATLILFDRNGNEVWRQVLGGTRGALSFSPDGKYIIAEAGYTTYLFGVDGKLVWKKENIWGHKYIFSARNKYILILNKASSNLNLFWIIETKTGKIFTHCKKEDLLGFYPYGITDFFATQNLEFIVVGARGIGKLKIFDFYGKVISEQNIGSEWSYFYEDDKTVFFSPNMRKIFILMKNGFKKLKLKNLNDKNE
jgi:hypothetical protein